MAIRKSSNSGIPFGNTASRPSSPSTGQPYFNGELQRLELYTGVQYGWQNIVAETPSVASYSGSILETNTTNTITITGTNFQSGAVASLTGSDGTEYIANSTTVNSSSTITAVFGVLPINKEPYDIKITNPSNLYGVYYDALTVNDSPIWSTSSGSLGTFDAGSAISIQLSASDDENTAITYTISSGSLPSGVTLSSSGLISGTTPGITSNTTYSFTVNASDGANPSVSRSFSFVSTALLQSNPSTLAYFDFASGRSYDGTSSLKDLSGRNKNLPISSATFSSTTNQGIISTSNEQSIRSTGLIGSISEISMGVWVKLDGNTNKGIIYYGDISNNNHFFIRDGIMGSAYNFDVGKDINGGDVWTPSKYNGSNMRNYITSVSGYSNKYWFYVVRVNNSGLVECSLNGSNFETVVNAGVNMSGHASGQFGLAGDPYNDNASSHVYGGAWWYQGLVSQESVNNEWNKYKSRFGWT
jgi:hypothetical protein